MFHRVDLALAPFEPYAELLDPNLTENLRSLAQEMRGARIVHVNSTPVGGGVAEILRSLVPVSKGLGLDMDWYVITPSRNFFDVTKKLHNLLQGADGHLTPEEMETYTQYGGEANSLDFGPLAGDVWFLHDPQLLPLIPLIPEGRRPLVIWVCHIDLSTPNEGTLDAVLPNIHLADAKVFSMPAYVPPSLGDAAVYVIPPAIDPLSVKNQSMPMDKALSFLSNMGIDTSRPLVTQVSRFDPWKDPWGVVDAYKEAKKAIPDLQLAYLGASHAADDPEGKKILESLKAYVNNDGDIHLYGDSDIPLQVVDRVVNAFQTASDVILQKSIREGFGLTVTEAMWKSQPVIGGNVGGIRAQIQDGANGFLVDSVDQCASQIVKLLEKPEFKNSLGAAARESVRSRFLLPRLLRDYLQVAVEHVKPRQEAATEAIHPGD
ncbi:MAG: glycosyltransferase [Dehalococcoidia bacterium]|nr:glycosyltransferase [Chloroflexota bacterium]